VSCPAPGGNHATSKGHRRRFELGRSAGGAQAQRARCRNGGWSEGERITSASAGSDSDRDGLDLGAAAQPGTRGSTGNRAVPWRDPDRPRLGQSTRYWECTPCAAWSVGRARTRLGRRTQSACGRRASKNRRSTDGCLGRPGSNPLEQTGDRSPNLGGLDSLAPR
jgi:hypothetical protein